MVNFVSIQFLGVAVFDSHIVKVVLRIAFNLMQCLVEVTGLHQSSYQVDASLHWYKRGYSLQPVILWHVIYSFVQWFIYFEQNYFAGLCRAPRGTSGVQHSLQGAVV